MPTNKITINFNVAKEARRQSRQRIKIPTGKVFKSNPKPGTDDDSLADPRIRFVSVDPDTQKLMLLVDPELVIERFSCNRSDFPLEWPKWRFVPKNEIWIIE